MEQAAQTDILILLLIFLSALIGFSRGFSFEAASLTVYIFAGFFGYWLIPAFLPAFSSFIPHDKTAWVLSLALGSFLSWIFLRMFVFYLAQNVKNSRFRRLDRSLGAVFGLFRGVVFLFFFSFLASAVSPTLFEKSKLMQLSFSCVKTLLRKYPELDVLPKKSKQAENQLKSEPNTQDNRPAEEKNWKESAAEYVLNTNVQTKSGQRSLLSVASDFIADGMMLDAGRPIPPEIVEILLRLQLETATGNTEIKNMTPEQQMLFLQQILEQREGTQ